MERVERRFLSSDIPETMTEEPKIKGRLTRESLQSQALCSTGVKEQEILYLMLRLVERWTAGSSVTAPQQGVANGSGLGDLGRPVVWILHYAVLPSGISMLFLSRQRGGLLGCGVGPASGKNTWHGGSGIPALAVGSGSHILNSIRSEHFIVTVRSLAVYLC